MRIAPLAALLLLAGTAPAAAQFGESLDRRLNRIEKELTAVQRKVFPGGAGATVEPEIAPAATALPPTGVPASSALADLTARVDALEGQLRTLTGIAEENGHRLTLLEQAMAQARAEAEARARQPSPATGPQSSADSAQAETPAAASSDPAEDAYNAAYRLWAGHRYAEAQKGLEEFLKKYPKHPRLSLAQNLLGRAYLDGGKPATAAKVFLGNYQANPKGERAQDSLFFLGQSLVQLNKRPEACKVYDELQDVYGAGMRGWVKQRLPKARTDADCG
ncbi:MAG: tetratricopeptide repeat protein [Sphingomonadales bacterium]